MQFFRVLVLLVICNAVAVGAAESLEQTIVFLLHRIETADATFIRNGSARAPEFRQAAGSLLGPNFVPGSSRKKIDQKLVRLASKRHWPELTQARSEFLNINPPWYT